MRGIAGQQDALVDALGVERLEQGLALTAQLLVELDAGGHADVRVHGRHLRVDMGRDHLRALGARERDRRVDRCAGSVAAVVAGDVDEAHWRDSFTVLRTVTIAVLWPDCLSLVRSTRLAGAASEGRPYSGLARRSLPHGLAGPPGERPGRPARDTLWR